MANRIDADNRPRQKTDTPTHLSPTSNRSLPRIDDVIVALANSHENRRARQVSEWEQMRHRSFPMTA